uniref:3-deoxy-manno-octulosonate cytidylyltransferase, mitochondrial-like n=1 Tax=Nicotiana tabacum TaxID=4097 RepID=A0A1S4BZK4_TOBAC|nr:3-deoxy-manno-octulosonate cytidylyltransferase, mitochondrial-like [Nicotiana tomentosiformis]XP_016494214.1 PREDICTED: 3-deoxy-manno-octulosonate cytidylyltransferase, mitochondrial-like [Nicotiana tabacum]
MSICSSSSSSSSSTKSWILHSLAVGAAVAVALGARSYLARSSKFRSRVIGIIPARFASTRFQGKPLVQILGKPMIQRTWERAKLAETLDQVVVATDDEKIAECCRSFGAEVIMTAESCRNGTERCTEALEKLGKKYDIAVNIQGDEPLIEPEIIDGIVKALQVIFLSCFFLSDDKNCCYTLELVSWRLQIVACFSPVKCKYTSQLSPLTDCLIYIQCQSSVQYI